MKKEEIKQKSKAYDSLLVLNRLDNGWTRYDFNKSAMPRFSTRRRGCHGNDSDMTLALSLKIYLTFLADEGVWRMGGGLAAPPLASSTWLVP